MTYDVHDFDSDVLEKSKTVPVVVDFWAEWCGPCKILGPVLEKLANHNGGKWALAKLDTEAHPQIARQYNIQGIPNVKLFADGKAIAEFVGAMPEQMVQEWIAKNIPSPLSKQLDDAETLLQQGNTDDAQRLLKEVIGQEPDNHRALTMLARSFVFSDHEQAFGLVEMIEEDSEYYDIAGAIRVIARLFKILPHPEQLPVGPAKQSYVGAIESLKAHDIEQALRKFIDVIREDRPYDDDGSRRACVAIFKLLGEEHKTTLTYRREFSRALY